MEYLNIENLLAAVVVGGTVIGAGVGLWSSQKAEDAVPQLEEKALGPSKKPSKKAKQPSKSVTDVKSEPMVTTSIPGGFDLASSAVTEPPSLLEVPKTKKKKSKGKKSTPSSNAATESEAEPATQPAPSSKKATVKKSPSNIAKSNMQHSVIDTDNEWSRVEASKKNKRREEGASTTTASGSADTNTDEEGGPAGSRGGVDNARKPLAERMLPKPRKTGVEDMVEGSDYPTVARVMRVAEPEPAPGFSWGDYEEAHTEDDDDEGWGVVKSRSGRRNVTTTGGTSASSSQTSKPKALDEMSKKQRQNAKKREAEKSAKSEAEVQRQAVLRQHQRDVEKARMASQSSGKGGKVTSGGMKATVSETGKLVWE